MTNQERTLATVSHGISAAGLVLSAGFLGWLVPLAIFYSKRRESKFVAFHALQSVYLQFGVFVIGILLFFLRALTFGLTWPLYGILIIGAIFFEIMAAIRANDGKWYAIPVAGQFTRQTLGDP